MELGSVHGRSSAGAGAQTSEQANYIQGELGRRRTRRHLGSMRGTRCAGQRRLAVGGTRSASSPGYLIVQHAATLALYGGGPRRKPAAE